MNNSTTALPNVALLGLLLGSSMVMNRFGLGQFDPFVFNFLQLLVASLAFIVIFIFHRSLPRRKDLWLRAMVYGLVGTLTPMTTIILSMQYLSSGVSALLLSINPVITMLIAHFVLESEPFNPRRMAGALLALCGAGIILWRGESGLAEFARADWRGYAYSAVSVLSLSGGIVFARFSFHNENPVDVSGLRIFSATLFGLPTLLLVGSASLAPVNGWGIAALLYAGTIGCFLAYLLEVSIITRFGALAAALVDYFIPVVTFVLGALLLGEQITPTLLVGMVVIYAGLRILN